MSPLLAHNARALLLGHQAWVVVFCFSIILPLAAQSSSYHLEFEDHVAFLVDDSEKPIEAFGISQRCHKPKGGSSNHAYRDILDSFVINGSPSDMRAADGGLVHRAVLETGGRWSTGSGLFSENGDCETQITAVLFSDGSFEGDDAAVRGLKAHRDGLADAVNYWADRIRGENPDGSTLDALHHEVKQHLSDDQIKQNKYPPDFMHENISPMWQYWSGWLQVERNTDLNFPKDLTEEKAAENFRKVADEINQWKKKIDGNLALQKLNVNFPPISGSRERQ